MFEKIYDLKEFLLDKKYLILGGVLLLIIFLSYYYFNINDNNKEVADIVIEEHEERKEEIEECFYYVDIKGFINNPGLYKLECDKRVSDVINVAGGLKENADTSVINLGKKIFDEMVIIIYSKDEVKNFTKTVKEENKKEDKCINNEAVKNDGCVTKDKKIESSVIIESSVVTDNFNNPEITINSTKNKISINKASLSQLMTLTGIGESKANAIIKYRNDNNGFKTLEELMNITGIGEKIFEKIKDSITL